MKQIWNSIQTVLIVLGGTLGWFLGGADGFLYVLIAFVVIDYITGMMCAFADRELSSKIGFKGICRKVIIFLLVGVANLLDVYIIGTGSVLRTAVIFFYLSNEGLSLLENGAHLGLPIPEKIKNVLAQLHHRSEKEDDLMSYTNSKLVSYTKISPNRNINRNHKIDTVSIHCVVGQCSVETLGSIFASRDKEASSNYGIGYDGRIGMYVEEKDRSWCTSSASNDNRAITIEVASDTYHPYRVNDAAYKSLIKLLVDICKRNGIKRLVWSTNKSERMNHLNGCNMTVHRDYANKSCPGDYLYNLHRQIAKEVNAQLGLGTSSTTKKTLYRVRKTWKDVKSQKGAFNDLSNAKKCADKNIGYSVFDANGKAVYTSKVTNSTSSFKVQISISDLNIRKGPGTNYATTGKFTGKGVFTIVETKQGTGSAKGWGKLKSGAGWIALDYATRI